jgi:hypothetical protein
VTFLARVLYEDKRGPVKEFGLHAFVLACVADRVGGDRWKLRKLVDGNPRNGVGKLIASCREEAADLCPSGERLFALVDEDRICDHVNVAKSDCRRLVAEAIKEGSTAPDKVDVVLLRQNLETVLAAIGEGGVGDPKEAIQTKDHTLRDQLLHRAAAAQDRGSRDCILEKVQSLERLVERITLVVKAAV